jgi:hypothetical protein
MVVVVQVGLFIKRFAARHLDSSYFTGFKQRIHGAVDRGLAYLRLPFLGQRYKVRDTQGAVRFHDNIMDYRALACLSLSDFDHRRYGQTIQSRHKAAIGNWLTVIYARPRGQNLLALCLHPGMLR